MELNMQALLRCHQKVVFQYRWPIFRGLSVYVKRKSCPVKVVSHQQEVRALLLSETPQTHHHSQWSVVNLLAGVIS